jgi:hypothetical protein
MIAEKGSFVIIEEARNGLPLVEAGELADKLIKASDERIDDKWGPAGCIPVIDSEGNITRFLFFGWASS